MPDFVAWPPSVEKQQQEDIMQWCEPAGEVLSFGRSTARLQEESVSSCTKESWSWLGFLVQHNTCTSRSAWQTCRIHPGHNKSELYLCRCDHKLQVGIRMHPICNTLLLTFCSPLTKLLLAWGLERPSECHNRQSKRDHNGSVNLPDDRQFGFATQFLTVESIIKSSAVSHLPMHWIVIRSCLVPAPKSRKRKKIVTSNILTHAWSTKWSLFTKLFAQMDCKSRDES